MRSRDVRHNQTVGTWALAVLAGVVCVGMSTAALAAAPASTPSGGDIDGSTSDRVLAAWWQPSVETSVTCRAEFDLRSLDAMLESTGSGHSGLDGTGTASDRTTEAPCSEQRSEGKEVSNNFCFEGAGAPATVRPELIAEYRTAQHSRRIAGIARTFSPQDVFAPPVSRPARQTSHAGKDDLLILPDGGASTTDTESPLAPNMLDQWTSTATELPAERDRRRTPPASCSVSPVTCESVPPGPPGIQGEYTAPVHLTTHLFTSNEGARSSGDRIPDFRRLGPADGYGSPPDPPPRRG